MRLALTTTALLLFSLTAVGADLKAGDEVWAQWRPNAWYHGKIEKKVDLGYHVKFDDGDEADVPESLIAPDIAAKKADLKPGVRVVALFDGPVAQIATVVKVEGDKVVCRNEELEDGTAELKTMRVIPASLKPAGPNVGDKVWAQWRPNDWFHGKITKKADIGYHVEFDDGDEADLPAAVIAVDAEPKKVKAGNRVLALWTNGKLYPGVVASVEKDSAKIKFEDGDEGDCAVADLRIISE